jgi:ketosteroid isomerase-like protein
MSQENVEIVRAAYAAYMSGDDATSRELLAPDFVLSARPDQPDVRDHRGYDGLLDASTEWTEAWDEHTLEAARIWAVGDFVFVAAMETARGKGSGIPMDTETFFVNTLTGGQIARIQIFGSEREALRAMGLEE